MRRSPLSNAMGRDRTTASIGCRKNTSNSSSVDGSVVCCTTITPAIPRPPRTMWRWPRASPRRPSTITSCSGARVMRACTASGCMASLFAAALLACGPFGTRGPHCQPRRLPLRRADGAFPKASRAAARISLDKVGSSTARARISAPIIPASVVIARLRRLAAVRSLKRRA